MSSDDSGGVEIQSIVEHLRGPPFNRSEGLVDFSKKSVTELLQTVNDVFALLDDRQKKDVRDETKEDQTIRMLGFVTVLGYKDINDPDFGPKFMSGHTQVVYPFLLWMLRNFDKLKTRGYLARYLVPLSIPEEHFADSQIVTMFQQYTVRQTEFKDVHRELEEARAAASNPAHLQAEVTQLENEKEQLHNKLEKMRTKISMDPEYSAVNFDEMLAITNKLRQEQETEAKLFQDAAEQRGKLQRAEAQRVASMKRFQEMNHSDMGHMDPGKLMARLRDEVHQRREMLETRVEAAIADKEAQLKKLSKLASSAGAAEYTEQDIHELQREKYALQQAIEALLQRRENSALANDSKISFIRDRLSGVDRRREKLQEQLAELEEEKREIDNDLRKVVQEFKQVTGANAEDQTLPDGQPRPRTDAEMKEYMTTLNTKTQHYKKLKAELDAERAEIQTLRRTEEILRSRAQNIEAFNAEQEKRLGVVGFSSAQDALESIAATTHDVNAEKGETLEELSAIIDRIKATLETKKAKLAPQIKDLRGVRADYDAIESVYKSKRNQYENITLGFDSDRLKLEQDAASIESAVAEEESHYHFLQCLGTINKARLAQVARENGGGSASSGGGSGAGYKDLYERAIAEQESITKSLRAEKKTISEKHESHVAQRAMFQSLRALLRKKLEITQGGGSSSMQQQQAGGRDARGGSGGAMGGGFGGPQHQRGGSGGGGGRSYLDDLVEESDRLVLDSQ